MDAQRSSTDRPVIQTRGLTKTFGSRRAVDRLDLSVPAGQLTGFLGPNGAGKSTTIGLLLGLLRPSAGQIELFGESAERWRAVVQRRIGVMLETPAFYPHLTVAEHLEVHARLDRLDRRRLPAVLERVDLLAEAARPTRTLSLGQRQRLGLALALLGQPELLILDEPTNGLDPAGLRAVHDLLRDFTANGGTVFFSSHRLSEVQALCSRVVILKSGRLIAQGAVTELLGSATTSLCLRVSEPNRAAALLTEAGWPVVVTNDTGGPLLRVEAPVGRAAEVNALLTAATIGVTELRTDQPGLEELFLRLTDGRSRAAV